MVTTGMFIKDTRCPSSHAPRFPACPPTSQNALQVIEEGHLFHKRTQEASSAVHTAKVKMAETIDEKIKNYRTAPFDARFPNTNQTRNCFQNYLDFHRCNKALSDKGQDVSVCDWYQRVYKSLCPMSWVAKWDDQMEAGSFPGKI